MSSSERKQENGSAMMTIGWALMLFAVLVFYFHPAEIRLGETRFAVIAGCLAFAGPILELAATCIKRRNHCLSISVGPNTSD
jgi:hypothetical protein